MSAAILAVDDNPANLQTLDAILGGLAGRVDAARSGDEALRQLLSNDYALVLLDIQMPNMDGYELARLIRRRERSRHTPIIFLTAYSRSEANVRHGYQLGAVDYLFKPVDPEALRAKVGFFLDLFEKTRETARQAQLLREAEHKAHQQSLEEAKSRFEQAMLRREAERERRAAEAEAARAAELARLVKQLEQTQSALKETDRRKNEFLAMLGHELRNPLAPIRNALELIRKRMPADDAVLSRAVFASERQVRHIGRLLDDLLDVARISQGKIELRREQVTLGALVEQAVEATEGAIRDRRHRFELSQPEEPLHLDADPTRIAQAIANLLHNAAKYTEPGGQIRLSVRREGNEAVVEVRDTGIGLTPQAIGRIFDIFVQEEVTSERAQGGLGLGLFLVRSVVQLHGGKVEAHSEGKHRGSAFVLRLPLVDPPARELAADAATTTGAQGSETELGPMRVLLVEDNVDIRETLRDCLELYGVTVSEAGDGPSALEQMFAVNPDVAIVDIGLPGLDGYALAATVRQRAAQPDRPKLIAVTGYGGAEARAKALAAGFDEHLVKPVELSQLIATLRRAAQAPIPQDRSRAPVENPDHVAGTEVPRPAA